VNDVSDTIRVVTGGEESPYSSLVDQLVRHRHALLALYVLLIGGAVFLLATVGMDAGITVSHGVFRFLRGDDDPWSVVTRDWKVEPVYYVAAIASIFFALQAGFLWGGGRIVIGRTGVRWYRIVVSTVIIASLATLLTFAVILLFMQFLLTDEIDKALNAVGAAALISILAAAWLVWLIIALVQYRDRDQIGALARLSGALIAGSWVEFALALPIDIAVRARHESCPCVTGSWLALLIVIPVMIWSFGPALYLLYLRERALAGADPGRPRRILRRKSLFRRRRKETAA